MSRPWFHSAKNIPRRTTSDPLSAELVLFLSSRDHQLAGSDRDGTLSRALHGSPRVEPGSMSCGKSRNAAMRAADARAIERLVRGRLMLERGQRAEV